MHISRVATLSLFVSCLAVLLLLLGPGLTLTRLVEPMTGFSTFLLGGAMGIVGLALGLVACFLTRPASPRSGRSRAVRGALLGAACLAIIVLTALPSSDLPPINDISTDTDDPPRFVAILEIESNRGRDMAYPGPDFAAAQHGAYSDLEPLRFDEEPAALLARGEASMQALGFQVHALDLDAGRIEASDSTWIFGFVDDVVVRVRPAPGGSRLDIRSKSRDGKGDLGANAARIRRLRDALSG